VGRHGRRAWRSQNGARLEDGVSTFRGPLLPRGRTSDLPVSLSRWTGFALIVAANAVEERYARAAREAGISLRDFVVLAEIGQRPGLSQTALSERVGLTRARVSQQLAVLDTAGYVAREMNELDLRRRRLWLSGNGERVVEEVAETLSTVDHGWLSVLERGERIVFAAALKRLRPAYLSRNALMRSA
jgi:DNA-binding MarR family transcriptional regulator